MSLAMLLDALPLAIAAAVPLVLAVQGEIVLQRSGILNLGLEGMMLVAAMTAVLAAQAGGSALIGLAGGIAGAAAIALLFGVCTIALRADQIVTGAAVNLLAAGVTGFVYRELQASELFVRAVPRLGPSGLVLFAWVVAPIALSLLLWNTTFGLRLRACGENPEAVEAAGRSVAMHRSAALAFEALLAGLAGAHLSLVLTSGFAENMTAGRGFIALSIVIFGRWKIRGALLGTAVFGIAAALQYSLQASGSGIPYHLLLAVPYVITLLILSGVAGKVKAPERLGR